MCSPPVLLHVTICEKEVKIFLAFNVLCFLLSLLQKKTEYSADRALCRSEYSTDLVFYSKTAMRPLYEELSGQKIFSVKAEQVVTFPGKKIPPQLA